MYGYIYDIFLSQKPYQKELIRIEHSLTDKSLNGHTVRLSVINNVKHAVEDLLKKGVTTIVAVGSDQLFSKLADQVELIGERPIGLIPLGSHQEMAKLFSIPEGVEACKTLAARRLCEINLSQINSSYFISSVAISDARVKIRCQGEFTVQPLSEQAILSIKNDYLEPGSAQKKLALTIAPSTEKKVFRKQESMAPTVIESPFFEVLSPAGLPVIIDGQKSINTPATLCISKKRIRIIMGKSTDGTDSIES